MAPLHLGWTLPGLGSRSAETSWGRRQTRTWSKGLCGQTCDRSPWTCPRQTWSLWGLWRRRVLRTRTASWDSRWPQWWRPGWGREEVVSVSTLSCSPIPRKTPSQSLKLQSQTCSFQQAGPSCGVSGRRGKVGKSIHLKVTEWRPGCIYSLATGQFLNSDRSLSPQFPHWQNAPNPNDGTGIVGKHWKITQRATSDIALNYYCR